MKASRRDFLVRSLLGTAGIAVAPQIEAAAQRILGQSQTWGSAMAATAGRKFALLVGVDRYSNGLDPLQGCATDVTLQQEVLEHRFGFSNIATLIDEAATRAAIEQTFIDHLIEQVEPNDSVVVHFSGYGRTLPDGSPLLMSADAQANPAGGEITDLPLETLYQLVQALNTRLVTVVLDCGFATETTAELGNWRVRSPLPLASLEVADGDDSGSYRHPDYRYAKAVLERQTSIHEKYRTSPSPGSFSYGLISRAQGNWIMAAAPGQAAAEGFWNGFSAGLLTYLLTQSLWEMGGVDDWQQLYQLTSAKAQQAAVPDERPILQGKGNSPNRPYSPDPSAIGPAGASGVIHAVQDDRTDIWLGGISPTVLPFLKPGTRFKDWNDGKEWVLKSREQLTARVEPAEDLSPPTPLSSEDAATQQPASQLPAIPAAASTGGAASQRTASPLGALVTEVQRVIPLARLAIALDNSLQRIEKVDVSSVLSNANLAGELHALETAQLQERAVDCLFGRMTPDLQAQLTLENPPEVGSYGLMWSGRVPLYDSFGNAGEAPKSAIKRLIPRLQHLLAVKRLRATLNDNVSQLSVVLEIGSGETTWQAGTAPAATQTPLVRKLKRGRVGIPQLKVGAPLVYTLENRGNTPIYVVLAVLDRLGRLCVLANQGGDNAGASITIASHSKVDLGQALGIGFAVRSPQGLTEVFAIASSNPMPASEDALQTVAQAMGIRSGFVMLPQPIDFAQTVLADLTSPGTAEGTRLLDHAQSATIGLAYTVVQSV